MTYEELAARTLPWFMAPSRTIVQQLAAGGIPIPWGEWLPTIMFYGTYNALMGLLLISVGTLLRRDWIDVEKIPFPHMVAAYELIKRVPVEKGSKIAKASPFLIGMVIGFVYKLLDFSKRLLPWFPDILDISMSCGWGGWPNRPQYVTGGIVGIMGMQKDPFVFAIAYLAPLSILFNVWFWYLVYLALTQIATYLGYYTGIVDVPGCCRYRVVWEEPFKWNALSTGAQVAWFFLYLVLARGYIAETFRAALRKLSPERQSALEKNEPMSYRGIYLFFGMSFVLMTALFMAAGLSLGPALLMPITFLVFWITNARMAGLSGTYYCTNEHGNTLYRLLVWPTPPSTQTQEFMVSAFFSEYGASSFEQHQGGAILTAFQGYRMASLTGVNNRNVLKASLLPTVLCPFLAVSTYVFMAYTFGSARLPWGPTDAYIVRTGNPANWVNWPGTEPFLAQFLGGALISIVLGVLHARFVWFPFEPVGFMIATGLAGIFFGFWTAALGAWILKTLTLKVGGSKLYENAGVPVACGLIAGYVIMVLLGSMIALVKFFVPF
jgi:hypothetical protein